MVSVLKNKIFFLLTAFMLVTVSSFGQIKITSFSITDAKCFGSSDASITFTTLNGPAPFTYILTGPAEDTVLTTSRSYTFNNLVTGLYILVVRDASGKFDVKFPIEINEPTEIDTTSATIIKHPTCSYHNNGHIILDIEGGTPPYTYSWNTGETTKDIYNLGLGDYTVTVTDANGCIFVKTFPISRPTHIDINPIITNISCTGLSNGSIDLNVSGGTPPYSYTWDNGSTLEDRTGLSTGSYNITVEDANGCHALGEYTITEPDPIALSGDAVDVTCSGGNNGQINLTVAGGTPPYSYSWSNGASVQNPSSLTAGNYSVVVTDKNGCTASTNFSISEPSSIIITGTSTDNSCVGGNDGKITTTTSGGVGPYTYLWNNGSTDKDLTGVVAGTYQLTVTDSKGCIQNASFSISDPTPIVISETITNASCEGKNDGSISISVSGGASPYTYSWSNGSNVQNVTGLGAGNYSVEVTDSKNCTVNADFTITQPQLMTVTADINTPNCIGGNTGSIDLTVTGGTAPFSYSWSNGATTEDVNSLSPGNYTVTITDNNGCSVTNTYTINQPADPLTASGTSINIECNGYNTGSIDLNVTGGTAPYSYSWNTGTTTEDLTGLIAGSYQVTVTDFNGCTANASFTITEPAGMTLSGTTSDVSCNGGNNGSINLIVTGGSTPYSFVWDNGATTEDINNLTAGNYSVTVTDNGGCSKSMDFTISEPLPITVSGISNNAQCMGINNGTINITVSGGTAPYTYSWSNGSNSQNLTGLGEGTYTVEVTDSKGCSANASFTITQPQLITVTNSNSTINCFGGNTGSIDLTVSGGTAPYSYLWSNGATTEDLNSQPAGNYTVTITDNNGCSITNSYTITQPVSALSISDITSNIGCNGGSSGSIDITVTGGTAPYTYLWNTGATSEDLTGLSAGSYNVTVTDFNGCTIASSFAITEPTGITLSGTTSDVTCNGGNDGSINLTVTGGSAPYSFVWSNSTSTEDLTNATAGNYTVTVTDNAGCSASINFTINEPTPIIITGNATNASCSGINNGAIDISVNGGTAPYSYSWTNGSSSQDLSGLEGGSYTITITDSKNCTVSSTFTIEQPSVLTVNHTINNIVCAGQNNGSINLTITDGVPPYSYLWNTGATSSSISNLAAGSYNVTISDNSGCSQSYTYTISDPLPISISSTLTEPLCNGGTGSILIDVAGGTTPYDFNWSNGASSEDLTAITAGNYTVTITDNNGCKQSKSFVLNEPLPISATAVSFNVLCNGGNEGFISLTAKGGTPSYSFNWDNGLTNPMITNLTAGDYTVTISDKIGCEKTFTYTITEPDAIVITPNIISPSCNNPNDGAIDISVTGGTTPYDFLWSTGETSEDIIDKSTGDYILMLRDINGCSASGEFTISDPLPLSLNAVTSLTDCDTNNGTIEVTVNNGTAPFTYVWDNGATGSTVTGLAVGTYSVTVTDSRACSTDSSFTISNPEIFVYEITATEPKCNNGNNGSLEIINIVGGQAPFEYAYNSGVFDNNSLFENLTAGQHLISIRDANGCQSDTSVVLTEPAKLNLTGTTNSPICLHDGNGTIILTATGGTPSYTYSQNNVLFVSDNSFTGVAPLIARNYYVKDNNGCIDSTMLTLTTFPIIDTAHIAPIITNLTCSLINTGAIELTNVTGGKAPYSYSLNNGPSQGTPKFTALGKGNYIVTIQDANGCKYNYPAFVNSPDPIDFTLTPTKLETCNNKDGSFTLSDVKGGIAPYTYSFNNSPAAPYTGTVTFSNLSSGIYSVEVSDNSGKCSVIKNLLLPKKPAPIPFIRIDSTLCFGSTDGKIIIDSLWGGEPLFTITISQLNGAYTDSKSSVGSYDLTTFNGLPADTFLMNVTDQECSYDISYYYLYNGVNYDTIVKPHMIIKQPNPVVVAISTTDTDRNLNTGSAYLTNFTGGTAPYFYSLDNTIGSYKPVENDSAFIGQLNTGNYKAFVKDSNQCVYSFDFTIGMGFFIPNLITPNGDNFNDRFEIVGLPIGSRLRIYNKWESRVYYSESYDNSWDGEDSPDGIYFFDLELPNKKTYKGWVEVLRK